MDSLLSYLRNKQDGIAELIARLVECESPSDDKAAVDRFVDLVASEVSDFAEVRTESGGAYGRHMRIAFDTPGEEDGQILLLGHSDTVWPVGTLKTMPFRNAEGRLWGPGVFDMKAGIAFGIFAARALRELDIPARRRLVMQLNADEEVGSYSSRHLTEAEARASVAVLVLEPAKDLDGKLKTGRKGGGHFRVRVTGKASHAGLDFESGASAIVEVARQIQAISEFTDLERGITVNPGVISGGTRTNVVADLAEVECDFRVLRLEDAGGVERKFRSLAPFDRRCSIAVEGELNRPPLERSDAVIKLFAMARGISRSYGHELGEATVGGGSDGNFTAGMGVPTLDGLGAVGEGAHASNESILVDRIADRTALIAGLIRAL